jgi:protein-S-isoprenylcysteine O-methyltransferase Ste14
MANILKHVSAFLLPITVLLIIPTFLQRELNMSGGLIPLLGILLMLAGYMLFTASVSMFSRLGEGTLAPWSPPRKLVTDGIYGHVRNPMISGVLFVLLGESLVFESQAIFAWFLLFFVVNNVYFSVSEEPGLLKRFGDEYATYKSNVPRWIPRGTPWHPTPQ